MANELSIYHHHGIDGAGNEKYVSSSGHQEAVYDRYGNLITSPANLGTYNYAAAVLSVGAIFGLWIMVQNHMLEPSTIVKREVGVDLPTRWYRYEFIVGDGALEQEWSRTASASEVQSVRVKCQAQSQLDGDLCEAHVSHSGTRTTRVAVRGNEIVISRVTLP